MNQVRARLETPPRSRWQRLSEGRVGRHLTRLRGIYGRRTREHLFKDLGVKETPDGSPE